MPEIHQEATMSNPPIYGRRGRIGLVVPANNSVIEPEFWSVLPDGVALYATRVMAKGDLTPAERLEYETYVMAGEFIAVLQAQARVLLSHGGQ